MRYFLIYTILVLISLLNFDFYKPKDAASTDGHQTIEKYANDRPNNDPRTEPLYPVTRVIDGDTIVVLINGEEKTVRYIGIDTPETVQPLKPVECFGLEASTKNKELVLGKRVKLVKNVSETDRYGRLLRYVYVADNFINLSLVQDCYANAYSYTPDIKYATAFREAEQEARIARAGLWGDKCRYAQ